MKRRSALRVAWALLLTFGLLAWNTFPAASDSTKTTTGTATGENWEISGDLTEACTCAVPCTATSAAGLHRDTTATLCSPSTFRRAITARSN